jgi:hypothetical protein
LILYVIIKMLKWYKDLSIFRYFPCLLADEWNRFMF